MSKKKRIALVIVLLAYLALGLVWIYVFTPSTPEPKADEELIRAFLDSLRVDSVQRGAYGRPHSARYDSLKAVWAMEKAEREALRRHRYDSAVHYWDSVRSVKDSIRAVRDSVYHSRKTTPDHPIDLATATEDSLRRVPGIGDVLASQIINYRDRLGGFVDVRQVLEVEHVPEEALAYLTLGTVSIKPLNINRATPKSLRYHPYITGPQALAIYEARRKYTRIAGWHELLRLPEFTETDKERLEPYVEF